MAVKENRHLELFAQGGNTYSKMASQYIEGVYPYFYEDFFGVDFVCGLGSNLIGWENNFSLPSQKEVLLAERLKALFPCIEKMKFVKTGSAACSAAIRIARGWAGEYSTWGMGYHGTDNVFISAEDPGVGCVEEGYLKFKNLGEMLYELTSDRPTGRVTRLPTPAAIIVEPVQLDIDWGNMSGGPKAMLRDIRRICTERKIALIFDEVITGFRVPNYCIANYFGIQPDIICLGKALGNGHPIAIVGGRADIMETPGYFISNTHNGELSAIEASLKTLDFLTEEKLNKLWELGTWFQREFNAINPKIQIKGYPTRGELQGEETFKAIFMQEMCRAGYLFGRAWFLNCKHTREQLEQTLTVAEKVCKAIDSGSVELRGRMPRPLFRRN